jgi:hypothetical protein
MDLLGPFKELQLVLKDYKVKLAHKAQRDPQGHKEHLLMLKHQ